LTGCSLEDLVAEEVRELLGRAAAAADDTPEMIDDGPGTGARSSSETAP
jgi:hypothetical protein